VSAFVAVLRIELHLPEGVSLKGKRKHLAPVKAQLPRRFGVSIAEVGHQDLWQRATLVATLAAGTMHAAEEGADAVERWLGARFPDGVSVVRHVASLEDLGL
jgi:uncharacterized protein